MAHVRHFIMHVHHASHGSAPPLNCGVRRHVNARYRAGHRRFIWKHMRSRWPQLSKAELRVVIRSAAARERNKPRPTRLRHRRARLVELYRKRFGDEPFLAQYSEAKLPALEKMWLPGGYAWWKHRIHRRATPTVDA